MRDMVNHPTHYTGHASGVECFEVAGQMGFALGNAFKYLFRFEAKGNPVEDLRKAKFYVEWFKAHPYKSRADRNVLPARMVSMADPDCEKGEALMWLWFAEEDGEARYADDVLDYIDAEIARRTDPSGLPFTDASAAPFLTDAHALETSNEGRDLDTYPHGWWIGALALVMAFVAGALFGRVW